MKQSHAECQGHDREPSHFSYILMQTVSFLERRCLGYYLFEVISSLDICLTTLVILGDDHWQYYGQFSG